MTAPQRRRVGIPPQQRGAVDVIDSDGLFDPEEPGLPGELHAAVLTQGGYHLETIVKTSSYGWSSASDERALVKS